MKVVVIGSQSFRHRSPDVLLESFSWGDLRRLKNLRDYDRIVINLLSANAETIDWKYFVSLLNPVTSKDVLGPEGEIVVIGDPRFDIPVASTTEAAETTPFLAWTLTDFLWDDVPSDSLHWSQSYQFDEFKTYLRGLTTTRYSLLSAALNQGHYELLFDSQKVHEADLRARIDVRAACSTRYGNPVAFELRFRIETIPNRYSPAQAKVEWGRVVLLPATDVAEEELISTVLRDFFGVELTAPEPEWLKGIEVPAQETVDASIDDARTELAKVVRRLAELEEDRARVREILRMLYETGPSLEATVLSAFEHLGASVERPIETNKEDGWLSVHIDGVDRVAVLEVKGTRGRQHGEDGLKQLNLWVDRGVRLRQVKPKGIFVGNHDVGTDPDERGPAFSPEFLRTAELHEFVVMTTTDLYAAYVAREQQLLDLDAFWSDLFSTSGAFDVTRHVRPSSDEASPKPSQ